MRGRTLLIASALLALTACQTAHIEKGADGNFSIRYEHLKHGSLDADVAANRHCPRGAATMVSDDASGKVRTYHCDHLRRPH
ncbi:MAG TPA: hypothetical protein VHC73_17125 [Vitreimonas sp.]|jgi:hypothetical protein|nr:hypothetical protein [Vitreimonas sp.]